MNWFRPRKGKELTPEADDLIDLDEEELPASTSGTYSGLLEYMSKKERLLPASVVDVAIMESLAGLLNLAKSRLKRDYKRN